MSTLAEHTDLRPLMFSVAYRMLGSVAEAEDVVQDAFVRLHGVVADDVVSPESYAVTVTSRLALDVLRSARVRREEYVGSWLPEPLLSTGAPDDPAEQAALRESVSTAFLVLLETLTPTERAVFLLREVFGYDYAVVSDVVGHTEASCRQLLVRAKRKIDEGRPRFEADPARRDALAERFLVAASSGDLAGLEALLAEDVVLVADGGGKAPAVAVPVEGRTRVARFVLGLFRLAARTGMAVEPVAVGLQPGVRVVAADGRVVGVVTLELRDGVVHGLQNQINPDKLGHLGEVVNLWEVVQGEERPVPGTDDEGTA